MHQCPLCEIAIRSGVRLAEIKLVQRLADNNATVLGISVLELRVEPLDPIQECFLRVRRGREISVLVSGHRSASLESVKHSIRRYWSLAVGEKPISVSGWTRRTTNDAR